MNLNLVAEKAKDLLLRETAGSSPCAVLLSNGVDSNSIVASLVRNNRRPLAVSFRLKDWQSTDWLGAKRVAEKLNLEFLDIQLPTDVETIFTDVKYVIKNLHVKKKANIECAIPLKYALDKILELGITNVYSGLGADGQYAESRKAHIAVRRDKAENNAEWLEAFRAKYYSQENPACTQTMSLYFKSKGGKLVMPYLNPEFHEVYRGVTHNEMHKPIVKMPIRIAFPEMADWKPGNRNTNLQLGDSKIAKNYEQLLNSSYNLHNYKAVIGIYNSISRGEL
jgi:asparagine synthetase B (glutamine-hydrolysing)